MTKRIIEITVETERLLVFYRRSSSSGAGQAWCARCNSQVEMITPVEAALLAGLSPSDVYRLTEAGTIHSGFTAEGEEVICLNSLRAHDKGIS